MPSQIDPQSGYVDLGGTENTVRLAAHQEYLRSVGMPDVAAQTVDHIGINAATPEAFTQLVAQYTVPGEKVGIYERGDRRIAMIWRGPGLYRVELFEPRANTAPTPGFIHYAFIWQGWKAHEESLRAQATVQRVGQLGNNPLIFLATPDGSEAEIVNEPISFE